MRPKTLLAAIFLLFVAFGQAQDKVKLVFKKESERDIWIDASLPNTLPSDATKTSAAEVDLATAGKAASDKIFVYDHVTGNLGYKAIGETHGTWTVQDADFKLIGLVKVSLESKGQPVAGAHVVATTGKRTISRVLDPSTKGEIQLYGLEPGILALKVEFADGGKPAEPLETTFKLSLTRSTPDPRFVVSLSGDVATVTKESPKSVANGTAKVGQVAQADSPFAKLVAVVLGLGVAAGAGYFLLTYYKKNPDDVKAKLSSLGVDIPEPQPDDDGAPPIAMPAPPTPPEKIVLGPPDPEPVSFSSSPRLIAASGDTTLLAEGTLLVGRDSGLGLSLPAEGTISRNHAQIIRSGQNVLLKDLGSTNGTFVNGNQIAGEQLLKAGDSVQFGAVKFRFEI